MPSFRLWKEITFDVRSSFWRAQCGGGAAARAPRGVRARHGGAVQVAPIKPTLKPPGTKHLKLKCDIVLSTFAFKFKLRRYTMGFCFYNNTAVAARRALQEPGVHRVLLLDWDVHHGVAAEI